MKLCCELERDRDQRESVGDVIKGETVLYFHISHKRKKPKKEVFLPKIKKKKKKEVLP